MKKEADKVTIEHDGTVQEVGDNNILVRILSSSACSGCHAESVCSLSGKEKKMVNISGTYRVSPGDRVTVVMKQSQGLKAVLLAYVIPFLMILILLITLISFDVPEPVAGLASVAILAVYFLILYFFRKRINEKFTFTLKT